MLKTIENSEVISFDVANESKKLFENLKKNDPEMLKTIENSEVISFDVVNESKKLFENLKKNVPEMLKTIKNYTKNSETMNTILGNKTKNEINQIQTINGLNLKNEILSTLSSNMSDISKMRKLYLELNKRLSYDVNYLTLKDQQKGNIINRNKFINFNLLKSKDVICFGWSRLYKELLIDAGIAENRITIMGKNHNWIEVDLGDMIIIADATENIKGIHDLTNVKAGAPTTGFAYLNKTESGIRLKDCAEDMIDIIKKQWINVDNEIGYLKHNKYASELYLDAKLKFQNSVIYQKLFSANEFNDKLKMLLRFPLKENMTGLEAYLYYKKMAENIFGVGLNKNMLEYNGNTIKFGYIAQGANFISKITAIQSNGNKTIVLYSKQFGIKIFNDEINANEFMRHPNERKE